MSSSSLWMCRKCFSKFSPDNEKNTCPNCGSASTIQLQKREEHSHRSNLPYNQRASIIKWIDDYFDNLINNQKEMEKCVNIISKGLRLEPSLDSVLTYFLGVSTGVLITVAEISGSNRDDLTIEMLPYVYRKIHALRKEMIEK